MYSLYSLSVVAATIRISPRASTDLNTLAASDGAPSADPAPTIVCASSTNRIRFGPLLQLADDVLDAVLEHAAQHGAGDHRVHLQVHDLAVAQPDRHGVGLELDAPRQPFDDGRLADARLADQHHRIGALAVAEDLQHLLDFLVAAEDRRQLVLPREQVEVGGEVLQERRQLEALLEALLAQLDVAHPRVSREESTSGSTPWRRRIETGTPWLSSKTAASRSPPSIDWRPARLAWWSASLKTSLVAGETRSSRPAQRRHQVQVLLDRLKNGVRVQLDVAHDLGEGVPFDLRERQEQMLVREQGMFPPTRFFDRAIDNPLRGFGNLARRDVEIFYVHGRLRPDDGARRTPAGRRQVQRRVVASRPHPHEPQQRNWRPGCLTAGAAASAPGCAARSADAC